MSALCFGSRRLSVSSLRAPFLSSVAQFMGRQTRLSHNSCGLVGYPNVGKSTLFNALTRTQIAQAANYPFCTIEPNVAKVAVPDDRLVKLGQLAESQKVVFGQLEIVDIAGLIRGASQGAGLGNQFLSNIRSVAVVLQVIRCFEDPDVLYVDNLAKLDSVQEMEIIRTELLLSDLDVVTKRLESAARKAKNDKEMMKVADVAQKALKELEQGHPARIVILEPEEQAIFQTLQLITAKPVLYILNVDPEKAATGNSLSEAVQKKLVEEGGGSSLVVSAKLEEEAASMRLGVSDEAEADALQEEYLAAAGLKQTGLNQVIQACSQLLNQQCYYTVGPTESRSWFIEKGIKAPEAAGVIHSDFEKGFICAEVSKFSDWAQHGSESALKAAGKWYREGKTYEVEDGDIMLFRHNVTTQAKKPSK